MLRKRDSHDGLSSRGVVALVACPHAMRFAKPCNGHKAVIDVGAVGVAVVLQLRTRAQLLVGDVVGAAPDGGFVGLRADWMSTGDVVTGLKLIARFRLPTGDGPVGEVLADTAFDRKPRLGRPVPGRIRLQDAALALAFGGGADGGVGHITAAFIRSATDAPAVFMAAILMFFSRSNWDGSTTQSNPPHLNSVRPRMCFRT